MSSPSAFISLPTSNLTRFTLEGLIGAGKSRFLDGLKTRFAYPERMLADLTIIDEPVAQWCEMKDENGKSILTYFYEDTKRNSFLFQINALMSRYKSTIEAYESVRRKGSPHHQVLLTERTIGTDRNVFAAMLLKDGMLNSIEHNIYTQTFDTIVGQRPECNAIEGVIYIHTRPEQALERIKKRNREGETMSLEYLKGCHAAHDKWLPECGVPVLIIDGSVDADTENDKYQQLVTNAANFMNGDRIAVPKIKEFMNYPQISTIWERAVELAEENGSAVYVQTAIEPQQSGAAEAVEAEDTCLTLLEVTAHSRV